jgi:flagellar basal body rod protein FlgG
MSVNIEQLAAVGLQGDMSRTASISHNLANVLTPGFKATRIMPSGFSLQLSAASSGFAPTFVPAPAATTSIDALPGALRPTSTASDVAIEGDSWFELAGGQGSVYTKVGRLSVGRDGTLLGPGNLPIMGDGGAMHLDNAPFSVGATGEVVQNGVSIGTLRRVRIEHAQSMIAMGDGVYLPGAARVSDARATDTVRSGVLEASNVDSAGEMVRLTETVRHFESLQKIVQGYDATLEATIRKLGEF